MLIVAIICILIVFVVLILSVVTTSKAYTYKHTVDPLENNPNLNQDAAAIEKEHNQNQKKA